MSTSNNGQSSGSITNGNQHNESEQEKRNAESWIKKGDKWHPKQRKERVPQDLKSIKQKRNTV